MEKDKSEMKEEEEISPSSSTTSSTDLKDWELFESDFVVSKTGYGLSDNIESELDANLSPSGLFGHPSALEHSGVEEVVTENDRLHCESNSSSDIDVIDECIEDVPSNMSIPAMDISFCPSEISSTLSASQTETPTEPTTVDSEVQANFTLNEPEPVQNFPQALLTTIFTAIRLIIDGVNAFRNDGLASREYFVMGLIVSLLVILPTMHIVTYKASLQEAKMEQMEGHIDLLQNENDHLKNKVLAKIETSKLFGELDKEVKNIKSENFKLHKSMQTVIQQLEEQTHTIKKGLEIKENVHRDPYKKEISKLKEQINLLRIDNEELQKQLVRIRYGKYPSFSENSGNKPENEATKFKHTQEETASKSKEESMEEIKELRKKLYDEINKLKHWKNSVEDLVRVVDKPYEESIRKKQADDNKMNHDKVGDEKHKNKKNKNKRFYDWSWKDIKKNFKGTLEKFPDVSDMISKYVLFDKTKVDGVLNTISQYYKKAQDKTKKILETYSVDEKTQNVKNDIWTLMGEMKNKWVSMKNEFLESHFGNEKDEEEPPEFTTIRPESASTFTDDVETSPKEEHSEIGSGYMQSSQNLDEEESYKEQEIEVKEKPRGHDNQYEDYLSDADQEEKLKEWNSVKEINELLRDAHRRFYVKEPTYNSWMFQRARHRAELRENDEEKDDDAEGNWYLRRFNRGKLFDLNSLPIYREAPESDIEETDE